MKFFIYVVLVIIIFTGAGGYYFYETDIKPILQSLQGLDDDEIEKTLQNKLLKAQQNQNKTQNISESKTVKQNLKTINILKKDVEKNKKLDLLEELLFSKKYEKALDLFNSIKNKSSNKELNNIVSYFLNQDKNNTVGLYLYSQVLYLEGLYLDSIKILYDLNSKRLNKKMQRLVHKKIDLTNSVFIEDLLEQKKMVHLLSFIKFVISKKYEKEYYTYILGKLYFDLDQFKDATNVLKKIKFDQLYGKRARRILYTINPPKKVVKKKIDKRPKVVIPKAVIRYSSGSLGKRKGNVEVDNKTIKTKEPKKFEKAVKLIRYGTNFMVKVTINNSTVLNMLLDTGASSTVIYEKSMNKIKHAVIRKNVKVQTASSTIKAKSIKLKSIALENSIVYNIKAFVIKTSARNTTDGLLGMNFFENYDFYIDQKEAILYLTSIVK